MLGIWANEGGSIKLEGGSKSWKYGNEAGTEALPFEGGSPEIVVALCARKFWRTMKGNHTRVPSQPNNDALIPDTA
jgi:hypothetical protein